MSQGFNCTGPVTWSPASGSGVQCQDSILPLQQELQPCKAWSWVSWHQQRPLCTHRLASLAYGVWSKKNIAVSPSACARPCRSQRHFSSSHWCLRIAILGCVFFINCKFTLFLLHFSFPAGFITQWIAIPPQVLAVQISEEKTKHTHASWLTV